MKHKGLSELLVRLSKSDHQATAGVVSSERSGHVLTAASRRQILDRLLPCILCPDLSRQRPVLGWFLVRCRWHIQLFGRRILRLQVGRQRWNRGSVRGDICVCSFTQNLGGPPSLETLGDVPFLNRLRVFLRLVLVLEVCDALAAGNYLWQRVSVWDKQR